MTETATGGGGGGAAAKVALVAVSGSEEVGGGGGGDDDDDDDDDAESPLALNSLARSSAAASDASPEIESTVTWPSSTHVPGSRWKRQGSGRRGRICESLSGIGVEPWKERENADVVTFFSNLGRRENNRACAIRLLRTMSLRKVRVVRVVIAHSGAPPS